MTGAGDTSASSPAGIKIGGSFPQGTAERNPDVGIWLARHEGGREAALFC